MKSLSVEKIKKIIEENNANNQNKPEDERTYLEIIEQSVDSELIDIDESINILN